MLPMKLSITAIPTHVGFAPILWCGPVEQAFDLAKRLGYDGVELHLHHAGDVNADDVVAMSQRLGLGVPTIGTGMSAVEDHLTFADPSPAVRLQAVTRVREFICLAARLRSAVTIGLLSGRVGKDLRERPARRAGFMASLKECCSAAADVAVTVLLEPLNRYECDHLNTLEDGLAVIEQIGAPNLKLLADTFHMNIEEADIGASLRRAGVHIGHVHLVDSNRQAPGHGHLDVRGILNVLRDIGYRGYLSFEVLPLPDSRRAAEDAIRNVKNVPSELSKGDTR